MGLRMEEALIILETEYKAQQSLFKATEAIIQSAKFDKESSAALKVFHFFVFRRFSGRYT